MASVLLHKPSEQQPFDLEVTLRCAKGHRWRRVDRRVYSSVIDGEPVWILQSGGSKDSVYFESTASDPLMESKLRHQFRLDDDLFKVYGELYERNAIMAELVYSYDGLRVMRVDPWECLVFAILYPPESPYRPGNAMDKTQQAMDDIAKVFARPSMALANGRYQFPTPEQVGSDAGLTILEELGLGLAGGKNYLVDLASYVCEAGWAAQGLGVWHPEAMYRKRVDPDAYRRPKDGGVTLEYLQQHELGDALKALRKIPGVGPTAANYVALFGLGHMDAFPVDSYVLRMLKSIFLDHPYAGYVSQFLFAEGLRREVQARLGDELPFEER